MKVLTLNSDQIHHFDINRQERTVAVAHRDGNTTIHQGVPDELITALVLSDAKDRYYQTHIQRRDQKR